MSYVIAILALGVVCGLWYFVKPTSACGGCENSGTPACEGTGTCSSSDPQEPPP